MSSVPQNAHHALKRTVPMEMIEHADYYPLLCGVTAILWWLSLLNCLL